MAVYYESTDEEEVNKVLVMLYEMVSNAEMGTLMWHEHEKYEAKTEEEFQKLVETYPQYESLFREEKEKWERYHEAVRAVTKLEDHGSSGYVYIIGVLYQSINLWKASFQNLLLYGQGQEVSFSDTVFTSCMIDDAYTAYINQEDEDWYNPYSDDEKDGLIEHHEAIVYERTMWNEWMAYRKTIAKSLPKDLRKIYNGCTNLLMRTKLLQLKNQNVVCGVFGSGVWEHVLPDSCSDKELLEYPGFNVVWDEYLDSLRSGSN